MQCFELSRNDLYKPGPVSLCDVRLGAIERKRRHGFEGDSLSHHVCRHFSDESAVAHSKWIWIAQRLTYGDITSTRALIGPGEYVAKQFDSVKFVDAKVPLNVVTFGYVDERKGAKVLANQRDVCY